MANKQLNFSVDLAVYKEFEKVAAEHLDAPDLTRLLVSKFSDLKQGTALAALTSIPKDLFKLRPGRPASGAGSTDGDLQVSAS